jgi:hypothetical protein
MEGSDMSDYWRKVLKGAWQKTRDVLGWSKQKVASACILVITAIVAGGMSAGFGVVTTSVSTLVALAIVGSVVFAWSLFETQAELYRAAEEETKKAKASQERVSLRSLRRRGPPDYEKWRHVETMDLQTAAQLWSDETPGMAVLGEVKETYAMLCGAIQSGQLNFKMDPTIDPRMVNAVREQTRQNPRQDMKITRTDLKAFAKLHGYDPKFLRDK